MIVGLLRLATIYQKILIIREKYFGQSQYFDELRKN